MKRRSFLKTMGVGASAAVVSNFKPSAPALAKNRTEWKMVTLWPKNFPGLGTGSQRIADAIKEMSDGRLTIKIYGAGELVPAERRRRSLRVLKGSLRARGCDC